MMDFYHYISIGANAYNLSRFEIAGFFSAIDILFKFNAILGDRLIISDS